MTDQILRVLLPILATVLVGIFSALLLPALRIAHALRRDLANDAQIVEKLDEPARTELRADMSQRAIEVVAYSKYPGFKRSSLVALMILTVLATGLVVGVAFDLDPQSVKYFDLEGALVGAFWMMLLLPLWAWIMHGWQERSIQRLDYVEKRLLPDDAKGVAENARIATRMLRAYGRCLFLVVSAWPYTISALNWEEFDWKEWYHFIPSLVAVSVPPVLAWVWSRTPELDRRFPAPVRVGQMVWPWEDGEKTQARPLNSGGTARR